MRWQSSFRAVRGQRLRGEGGALAEVQDVSKTCHAVKVVLSAYNLAPNCPKSLKVFKEQVNFLAMGDVVCAPPWPQWLVKHFAELDIQLAPLPIVFWRMLQDASLAVTVCGDEASHPQFQIENVSAKIIALTQLADRTVHVLPPV